MSAQIVHLQPAVDQLVEITSGTDSLSTIQSEACRIASDAGPSWSAIQTQMRELQSSDFIPPSQKLLLASCERYFLAYHVGYENYQQSYCTALPMLSLAQPKAAIGLLVSNAKCCASAGDFEQSLGFLVRALDCASLHPSDELYWPTFSAAVFCFNRMGLHRQALQYAQHCLFLASRNSDTGEQQISYFKVLNTARLSKVGSQQQVYKLHLNLLNQDQSGYNLLNQFLLPVYAALESLENPQPNCRSASRNLAIAGELGHYANDYGIKQYLLALSLYHLAFGQRQKAQEAILEAACLMPDADVSLTRRIRSIHQQLGLAWQNNREAISFKPASQQTFAAFNQRSMLAIKNRGDCS